jgi:hypothetical protein
VLALLAAALPAGQASAQAPAPPAASPVDALRAVYRTLNRGNARRPLSADLARLYAQVQRRSRQKGEPLSGIDFDPAIDGQDHDEKVLQRTLKFAEESRDATKALVEVSFVNGDPRVLAYDMVLENGRWRIDNIRRTGAEAWSWRAMLQAGLKE